MVGPSLLAPSLAQRWVLGAQCGRGVSPCRSRASQEPDHVERGEAKPRCQGTKNAKKRVWGLPLERPWHPRT
eukprot:3740975-Amphidinium_carterae.1